MKAKTKAPKPAHSAAQTARRSHQPFFQKAAAPKPPVQQPQAETPSGSILIGHPQDAYEQAADAIVESALHQFPDPESSTTNTPLVQRQSNDPPANHLHRKAADPEQESFQMQAESRDEEETVQAQMEDKEQESIQRLSAQADELQRQVKDEPEVQQKAEQDEKDPEIQPKTDDQTSAIQATVAGHLYADADFAARLQAATQGGKPLAPPLRQPLEKIFGVDFSQVYLHTDANAARFNREIGAKAFTYHNHIFFNQGQFDPASTEGRRLMIHEFAHIVQKGVAPAIASTPSEPPADTPLLSENPASLSPSSLSNSPASPVEPPPSPDQNQNTSQVPETTTEAPPTSTPEPSDQGEIADLTAPDAEGEAVDQASPKSPQEDSDFQAVMQQAKRTKRQQEKHEPAGKKLDEVQKAAVLPEDEQEARNDRQAHLQTISSVAEQTEGNQEASRSFKPEDFKKILQDNLDAIKQQLPDSEARAEEFKREKPLKQVKENIGDQVAAENQKVAAPMTTTVTQDPPDSDLPVQTPETLPEEPTGSEPAPINSQKASPKPMSDSEISMQEESQSLDDLMAEKQLTEDQLAQSNEPMFMQALDTKLQAQQEAQAVPQRHREQEEQLLASAQKQAKREGQNNFGAMFDQRTQSFGAVFTEQGDKERADKAEQQRINEQLGTIYNDTKKDVNDILTNLSTEVNTIFTREASAATKAFEEAVEEKLDDIYGVTVIDDVIFGEDTEAIAQVFEDEKESFLIKMNSTLDTLANLIASQLNAAVARIQKGKQETQTFHESLDTEQKRLAQHAMDFFTSQYEILEESVNDKQQELARSLAESYQSNVDALQEKFDTIKEEVSKSWIGKAVDFIVDVGQAIGQLVDLLLSVLSSLADLIDEIIAHPIRFLENLASGIKAGFEAFIKKIDEYLISGFFDWLRGKVSGAGIQMPDKFDAAGLFSLATQLIGLTYQTFREQAVIIFGGAGGKQRGEEIVGTLEKGTEVAAKGLEIFQVLRQKQSLGELRESIKQAIASNIDETFDKIKETVLYETIEKVLIFIGSLFTPVGAFIKAAQTLYRGLKFLVENIDRISELVNAFLSSLTLAVQGNVAGIAQKIVFALRNFMVIAIDFLAKLLGLGNLDDKVQRLIQTLQKPIIRAIQWFLKKVKPIVVRLFESGEALVSKGKAVAQKAKEKLLQWWRAEKTFTTETGESHTLYFKGSEKTAQLMIATQPMTYSQFINRISTSGRSPKFIEAKSKALEVAEKIDANRNKDADTGMQSENMVEWLNELAKHTKVIASERPQNPPSVIRYGGVNSEGGGTNMTAEILSSNTTKGSAPTDNPKIWQRVSKRKGESGLSVYVQGHLLNNLLGGPGRAYNLTPITRSANASHEADVESSLKQLVLEQNKVVKYVVKVKYGGHSKRDFQTKLEQKGKANRTSRDNEKLSLMRYEQKHMPTELSYSWQLLRYDAATKQWIADTQASNNKDSGKLPAESMKLPDDNFIISK